MPCIFPVGTTDEGACALACPGVDDAICGPACDAADPVACVAGWSCLAIEDGTSCVCEQPGVETCDATDEDCDGVVDPLAVTDPQCVAARGPGMGCVSGECRFCPERCTLGADVSCTDFTLSSRDCGGCFNDCFGEPGALQGACSSNGCRQVDLIVEDSDFPQQIATAGTHLVWKNSALEIVHCTLPACADAAPLATNQNVVAGLAVAGDTVFWVGGSALRSCAATGCAGVPATMTAGDSGSRELVADGGRLYWIARDEPTEAIFLCDAVDCVNTRRTLASGRRGTANLVAVGADVYWTERDPTTDMVTVQTCPVADCSGGPVEVVPAQPEMLALGVRGDRVYWPLVDEGMQETSLLSCERTGCTTPRRDATGSGGFRRLAHVPGGFVISTRNPESLIGCIATDCHDRFEGVAGSLDHLPGPLVTGALIWATDARIVRLRE